jgi:hypothetical protein
LFKNLTKTERAWVLYDVGNSAFTMLACSLIPIWFKQLAIGTAPGQINGLPTQVSSNVPACPKVEDVTVVTTDDSTKTTTDHVLVGNFSDYFKWGYAKEIPLKVIEYGDPDNSGRDLQGYNEIYVRSEIFVGWGILVPNAFAMIRKEVVEAKA